MPIIEFTPAWRENGGRDVVAWAGWYLDTGDCIAEYPHDQLELHEWFWCEHFVNVYAPTDEEITMFNLQFGKGMFEEITDCTFMDYSYDPG